MAVDVYLGAVTCHYLGLSVGMLAMMLLAALSFSQGALTPEGVLQLPTVWVYAALIFAHMVYIIFCGTWGVVLGYFLERFFLNFIRTSALDLATAGNWVGGTLVTLL